MHLRRAPCRWRSPGAGRRAPRRGRRRLTAQPPRLAADVEQARLLRRALEHPVEQDQRLVVLAALISSSSRPKRSGSSLAAYSASPTKPPLAPAASLASVWLRSSEGGWVANIGLLLAASAAGRRGRFGAQVVPDLAALARVVAGIAHQRRGRSQSASRSWSRVKAKAEASVASWPSMPTTPKAAMKVAERASRLRVAQPVEGVALQVVAELVAEHRRELRLVLHAQQQAAPDLQHAVRRHARVEERRAHRMHADVGAMLAGELAGDALQVVAQGGVADRERAAAQPASPRGPSGPQAALVAGQSRGGRSAAGCARAPPAAGRAPAAAPRHAAGVPGRALGAGRRQASVDVSPRPRETGQQGIERLGGRLFLAQVAAGAQPAG